MDETQPVTIEEVRHCLEQFRGRRIQVAMSYGMGADAEAVEFGQDAIREIREILSEEDGVPRAGVLALLERARLKVFAGDIEEIDDGDEGHLAMYGPRYTLYVEDMEIAGKPGPQG